MSSEDPPIKEPAKDEPNPFQERAQVLTTQFEANLRTTDYRVLLDAAKHPQRDSDWALVVAGGTLALMLPHLKDLLELYSLLHLQITLGMLLASGVLGFMAKQEFVVVGIHLQDRSEIAGGFYAPVFDKYCAEILKIAQEAKAAGMKIHLNIDLTQMLKPIEAHYPSMAKSMAKDEMKMKDNPDLLLQKAVQTGKRHKILIAFQIGLIMGAFTGLLIFITPAPRASVTAPVLAPSAATSH